MSRTVMCSKFQKELPGLDKPPFGGEIPVRNSDSIGGATNYHTAGVRYRLSSVESRLPLTVADRPEAVVQLGRLT